MRRHLDVYHAKIWEGHVPQCPPPGPATHDEFRTHCARTIVLAHFAGIFSAENQEKFIQQSLSVVVLVSAAD